MKSEKRFFVKRCNVVELLVSSEMTNEEFALAQFAQGVLNRKGFKIFIDIDRYLDYLSEEYCKTDIWQLLQKYSDEFDGAVVFDLNCNDVGINMTATLCAAEDLLGCPRAIIDKVNALGLKTCHDMSKLKGSNAERQRNVWWSVKSKLNNNAVVHQVVKEGNFHLTLRDFSVCNGWLCFYTSENEEDRLFRKEVLGWLETNSPVYGWNDDEIAFLKDISSFGDYAVPTDWSSNHSYFGQISQQVSQRTKRTEIAPSKHYLAIVVSDGDNVQWLERDFATTSTFGQRQRSKCDYKMSWTFSPSLAMLCPSVAQNIFNSQKHDYFISGVSGIGYANWLTYPREHLDCFTEKTSCAMKNSDLSVVCLLDNVNNATNSNNVADRLSSYARFDNILGGICEMDPDRYGSGKGKIFWAKGKPFVSVRFTMWHPSGKMQNVTTQWLDEFADAINGMPVCPFDESGYTVLNVHPWTINMDSLDYVVSKLSSNVELVYADELVQLVRNNVQHEDK
ncbi:MAG: hypothetical protein ACI4QH_04780 [Candidatus Fimimonas sp.]